MYKGDINCPLAPDVFVAELLTICRLFKIAATYSLVLLHSDNAHAIYHIYIYIYHIMYILYCRWFINKAMDVDEQSLVQEAR